MSPNQWFEFRCFTPTPFKDALTNYLFELGAEGVTEDNTRLAGSGLETLQAFFRNESKAALEKDMPEYLSSLGELFPEELPPRYEILDVVQENWADTYKKFYQPQRLTNRFFLQPKWNEASEYPMEMIPIVMDPGQAFGTGLHATTRLCLKMIQHARGSFTSPRQIRLLDVGTGTGILAIAAEKLGVGEVVAIDNDPLAVEVAVENCEHNGCRQINISATPLEDVPGQFDIVVANILLETHRELIPHYLAKMKPNGQLILSGVLGWHRRELKELVEEAGLRIEVYSNLQEWMSILARVNCLPQ